MPRLIAVPSLGLADYANMGKDRMAGMTGLSTVDVDGKRRGSATAFVVRGAVAAANGRLWLGNQGIRADSALRRG